MYQGFYNLTSGMLSQTRRLDVISNNMANTATSGYRRDTYLDISFEEELRSRVGNTHHTNAGEVGDTYFKLVPSEVVTDFSQGFLEPTKLPLDFGIEGDGFFAVEWEGQVGYTRSGSFSVDNDGNLFLPYFGYVHDTEGNTIQLGTDNITVNAAGDIFHKDTGEYYGTVGVFQFEDNDALVRADNGLFTGDGAVLGEGYNIWHGYAERSNVDMATEMVNLITAQRHLQSAASVFKIYDQLLTKAVNDVGRK